jgi:homoserine kinase
MSGLDAVTIYVPGSVGNVGPGLDILGLAIAGAGDTVHAEWCTGKDVVVVDAGHPELPTDAARNTAAIAASAVWRRVGIARGLALSITKGLPLSGGQGGSAASAVGGAVAANRLSGAGLDTNALLECAMEAEATVAGQHADNLAPSLLGGLVLVRSVMPMDVVQLPIPASVRIVLVQPAQRLNTRDARAVLPPQVSREIALHQAAHVAAMVAGACLGDLALLGRGLDDRIAEPARRALLPGFETAQVAARAAGALGGSISGAGPTAFALVESDAIGARVLAAMQAAYASAGMITTGRVAAVDFHGAREL